MSRGEATRPRRVATIITASSRCRNSRRSPRRRASKADRLLELSRRAQELLDGDSAEGQRIAEASQLLGLLLLQDVERAGNGGCLNEGVSRDRMRWGVIS